MKRAYEMHFPLHLLWLGLASWILMVRVPVLLVRWMMSW